jgi:hypothetical protein
VLAAKPQKFSDQKQNNLLALRSAAEAKGKTERTREMENCKGISEEGDDDGNGDRKDKEETGDVTSGYDYPLVGRYLLVC